MFSSLNVFYMFTSGFASNRSSLGRDVLNDLIAVLQIFMKQTIARYNKYCHYRFLNLS